MERLVEIAHLEPMTIVGWQTQFTSIMSPEANSSSVIGSLWTKTFDYGVVSKLPGSLGHPTWGVIWHDPGAGNLLNYLAGVPFGSVPELPAGMSSRGVPGGRFAKITHTGPLTGLKETIDFLHRWAKDHGHSAPGDWCELELYDERFFKEGSEQAFDYFMAIAAPQR